MTESLHKELLAFIRNTASHVEPLEPEPLPASFLPCVYPDNREAFSGIKAVVFDIYGTLFSSSAGDIAAGSDYSRTNLDALALRYAEDCTGEELKYYFCNAVMEEHGKLYPQTPYPEVRVEEIWAEFPKRYKDRNPAELALAYELAVNPVSPMPGASECLAVLRDRSLCLGIVSNAQFYTPLLFEAYFGKNTEELGFDRELCAYSYLYQRAKPSPELFAPVVQALKERGIESNQALYIGNDMLNDVLGAAEAGFKTVLFAGDGRSLRLRENNKLCTGLLPDAVIQSLTVLPRLIGSEDAGE